MSNVGREQGYRIAHMLGVLMIVGAVGWSLLRITGITSSPALLPLVFFMVFQMLLGGLLLYAAQLKKNHSLLSQKFYPASIAAAILYLLMLWHWLQSPALHA
ncbi:hypothetical protein [Teredinibacter turnerae]|uniref:hypothetical protein n=1 Tax=Teredinibacter turnerae TaxID=2426 RepID=UPI0030CD51B6